MSTLPQLQTSIAETEALITVERMRLLHHKSYFAKLRNKYQNLFIILLIPTFLLGWYFGKKDSSKKHLKKFANKSLMGALNIFQQLY